MSNMHTLELLVRWHKGCGILVTFSHMVAISCFAACENIDWQKRRFKDRKVPLSKYGVLVLLFFVVQTLNNKAFAFDISIPLHLVFRSGSTMASLLVGSVYLNRTYSFQTVLAVAVTTCGVVTTTFASAPIPSSTHQDDSGYLWWLCGVAVMSLTLLISAGMGAYQDLLYQSLNLARTEVPWQETLFYTHVLSIPVFGLVSQDILHHAVHIPSCCDDSIWVPLLGEQPRGVVLLVLNVCSQYVCIRGVYWLIGLTSSLTCNFVLSLRKFLSAVVSIYAFGHEFRLLHGIGAALVVLGTVMYTWANQPSNAPAVPTVESKSKSQ